MKVAIYARVSTREQHPENQEIQLVEYAKRMGWEYKVFKETESSRKTRPIKQDLINRLRQKEFDGVVVLKLDRWARSLTELIMDVQELTDKGITFISIRDNIDLSTASGKLQFHILSALAEFERALIRERTMDGLDWARAEGRHGGRRMGAKDKKTRSKSGYWARYNNGGKEK